MRIKPKDIIDIISSNLHTSMLAFEYEINEREVIKLKQELIEKLNKIDRAKPSLRPKLKRMIIEIFTRKFNKLEKRS
jgi:Holliday junction resolvase